VTCVEGLPAANTQMLPIDEVEAITPLAAATATGYGSVG